MQNFIKRYVPYAIITGAIYLLLPLIFLPYGFLDQKFTPMVYDVVFPLTAVVCAVIYARKYGIDFFFSLVAPVLYIPSMLIYNGISMNNIIFVAIYLVSSIFGLFVGDMFFGSKNREPEEEPDLDIVEPDMQETRVEKVRPQKDRDSAIPQKEEIPEDEIDAILNDIHNKN